MKFYVALGLLLAGFLATETAKTEEAPIIHRIGSQPSQVIGTSIAVSDLRRSLDFYTKVLGMKEFSIPGVPRPDVNDPNAVGKVCLNFSASQANEILSLQKAKDIAPTKDSTKFVSIGLKVVDVPGIVRRTRKAGGTVVVDTTKWHGATVAVVRDPDGYGIEIVDAPSVTEPTAAE